ncbi:hypothetical protein GGI21_002500, partial [Coemansia aciculifera]
MFETNRKSSRETCVSTPSPASSPLTPGMDAPPAEPLFAEYDKQSATLDSIGAWSAVQPNYNQPPGSDANSYSIGSDMRSLGSKYNAMCLGPHSVPTSAPGYTTRSSVDDGTAQGDYVLSTTTHAQAHTSDVDYTELDEAILRGRSTTLPNIFAAPNPLYRFSPGPISPASNSTFNMLSRHGSMSVASNNRTVSPLGLPLVANPIHQSASLDTHFTATLDSIHSHTGSSAGVPHVPVRRFSEFSIEQNSYLALAAYSMAPHFAAASGASAQTSDVVDAINASGASHGVVGRPTFAPSSISATSASSLSIGAAVGSKPAMNGSSLPSARGEESAYPQPAAAPTRYSSFNHHLPTMREEESPSAPLSPPNFADSVLMRNMGFSAMPLPLPSDPPVAGTASSPLDVHGAVCASVGASATSDASLARDAGAGGSYLPLRVKSLKDLRRPSLDSRSSDQIASALFERAAGLQQSMSLNHLPGIGRRHSLSTSNLSVPTSTSATNLDHEHGGMPLYYPSEYSVYPPFGYPGHGFAPAMHPYGAPSGQQQQQFHPFALGSAPIARVPGGVLVNNGPMQNAGQTAAGSGMYGPHMLGVMAAHPHMSHLSFQSQYHHAGHSQAALGPASYLGEQPPQLPPLPQPIPVTLTSSLQTQQQQHVLQQQHHTRRASHPAISSMDTPATAASSGATAHSGSHALLPNPATTITPNMPFADMGKGLAFSSLPKGTRVFVVQFKGSRCDLYFAPNKGVEPKIIPTLALAASQPVSTSAVPLEAATYEPGTYVLVEADRG